VVDGDAQGGQVQGAHAVDAGAVVAGRVRGRQGALDVGALGGGGTNGEQARKQGRGTEAERHGTEGLGRRPRRVFPNAGRATGKIRQSRAGCRYFARMGERRVFSLRALNDAVRRALEERVGGQAYWVQAEIAAINHHRSGHLYLELVDERDGLVLAKAQAVLWKDDAARVREALGAEADRILAQGSEIRCRVLVDFHVVYGLKLVLQEIDLAFNLGRLALRQRETMAALKAAGLLERNGRLALAAVPQRLLLVGAPDTAGFTDFVRHLLGNAYGYRFAVDVAVSRVQGEGAGAALAACLQGVRPDAVDAVVLVRGGGAQLDLDAYNDRALGEAIARCPVPVITGIGHETDRHVADAVAHTSCKTPTAVAAFLVDRLAAFEGERIRQAERAFEAAGRLARAERGRLERWTEGIGQRARRFAAERRAGLERRAARLLRAAEGRLKDEAAFRERAARQLRREAERSLQADAPRELRHQAARLARASEHRLAVARRELEGIRRLPLAWRGLRSRESARLAAAGSALRLLDPAAVLAKGYAIVRREGRVIDPAAPPPKGSALDIEWRGGRLRAEVRDTEPGGAADAPNPNP
jgi:exodeoxyribonuclease VII large subunit